MHQVTVPASARFLRGVFVVAAAALLVVSGGAATANQQRASSQTTLDRAVFVPCAGPDGEMVDLSGTLISSTTTTGNGVARLHYTPAAVTGTGETTGVSYHGTGVSSTIVVERADGATTRVSIENFRLISEGSAPNLTFHLNLLVTFNADGSVTATVDNVVSDCA